MTAGRALVRALPHTFSCTVRFLLLSTVEGIAWHHHTISAFHSITSSLSLLYLRAKCITPDIRLLPAIHMVA